MIRTLIVDDEEQCRHTLSKLINRHCPELFITGEASSVSGAARAINEYEPDLVFLDVEMPGGNGFKLFDIFENHPGDVIFVTGHEHYAVRAFRYAALDYLLKPVPASDLKEAVGRYHERAGTPRATASRIDTLENCENTTIPQRLALPTREGYAFVDIDNILYCKAEANYTRFFLLSGEQLVASRNLGEFDDLLTSTHPFARVHKSYLVNVEYVCRYVKGRGGTIVMRDGREIEVSTRRRDEFLEHFARL